MAHQFPTMTLSQPSLAGTMWMSPFQIKCFSKFLIIMISSDDSVQVLDPRLHTTTKHRPSRCNHGHEARKAFQALSRITEMDILYPTQEIESLH